MPLLHESEDSHCYKTLKRSIILLQLIYRTYKWNTNYNQNIYLKIRKCCVTFWMNLGWGSWKRCDSAVFSVRENYIPPTFVKNEKYSWNCLKLPCIKGLVWSTSQWYDVLCSYRISICVWSLYVQPWIALCTLIKVSSNQLQPGL